MPFSATGFVRSVARRCVDAIALTFGLFGEDLRRRRAIRQMRELDARTLADSGVNSGGPAASGRWPLKPIRCRIK